MGGRLEWVFFFLFGVVEVGVVRKKREVLVIKEYIF